MARLKGKKDALIRIGISTCLLGQKVRFDGGHKRDRFITDLLGEYFEFVPICPEVDIGMGVPREAVHLAGDQDNPRIVGSRSDKDWTDRMNRYSVKKAKQIDKHNLSGYILKAKSPSCGMERVKLYTLDGKGTDQRTIGLYARHILERYPLLPVEEEGRLNDAVLRENFIVRVFAYHRLQHLFVDSYKRADVIRFHTIHKYLLLAHSPGHYKSLGQLVAAVKQTTPSEFRQRYSALFMEGLRLKSTTAKNTNVLMHMAGFVRNHADDDDRKRLQQVIEDYRKQLVPLIVPMTLLRHFVEKFNVEYLADQIYLTPHPKEMMLRNHV
ncbi:MAG: DUF1722 domain-containing protein [Candidatus Zixiibacteriota bacterium]|nr:MAG: DUF1722 domain-containing protein [candidate division Zixibacteria bacterium]